LLAAKLKEAEMTFAAEHDAKVHLQQQADKMLNQVENLQIEKQSAVDALLDAEQKAQNYYSQLIVANNALAGERAVCDGLKTENSLLTGKLEQIRTIVGG